VEDESEEKGGTLGAAAAVFKGSFGNSCTTLLIMYLCNYFGTIRGNLLLQHKKRLMQSHEINGTYTQAYCSALKAYGGQWCSTAHI